MSEVVVLSIGARTPIGLTAEASAAAVRAGICRVREHPFLVDAAGEPLMAASDGRLDPELLGRARLEELAASALREAAEKAFPDGASSPVMSIFLALPELRPGFSASDARATLRALDGTVTKTGRRGQVELAGAGHAGALRGIAAATEQLRAGRCQVAAVGGVESYFEADTLDALADRLGSEGVRSGFHPGEGAGFLILALASTARQLGLRPLATLRGAFAAMEERSLGKGVEVLGHGLAAAISGAAAGIRLPDERVDRVLCDINGERYRSEEWGMAALRTQRVLATTAYDAPADLWGDIGAAWGALGCILAVRSWARNYAPGPRALVWGSSDGGLRGAVVLQEPGRE